jgi:hypothetical protein
MLNRIAALAVVAALMLPAAGAFAAEESVALTDEMTQEIRTKLTGQGYEVGKIKAEDGLIEAYARKDGQKLEIYLNSDLEIVRTTTKD